MRTKYTIQWDSAFCQVEYSKKEALKIAGELVSDGKTVTITPTPEP